MADTTYVSGHFDVYYQAPAGSLVKIATREGARIRAIPHEQVINDDEYGEAAADVVNLGQDYQLSCDWVDYAALVSSKITENHENVGTVKDNVGKLGSSTAGIIKLIPATGTPAETQIGVGKAIYCPLAKITTDVEFMFGSKLHQGPLTCRLLPVRASGTYQGKAWYIANA
jgi:hypothetical protein